MVATESPRALERRGHGTRRYQLPMHDYLSLGPNPSGLCMCGCGGVTSRATETDYRKSILKGQHRRYLKGHHVRGVPRTDEVRRKISAANKGTKTGAEHRRWNGGRQMRRGRLYILVGSEHPMAGPSGYVAEYRLIAAEKIGRYLTTDEHVHHVDLDETNNAPDNLVVLSRSQHMRVHMLIRRRGLSPDDALATTLAEAG